jgi:hypothetical protein
MRLDLEKTVSFCDIGMDYVVLHPDVAGYIQGDGDDHALVQSRYMSDFRPSSMEEVQVAKPRIRNGNVSPFLAYFKGAKAQGSIGHAFNAMIKAIAYGYPEAAAQSAMAINAFAQGVKKDAILPEASTLSSGIVSKEDNFHKNLADLITSKGKPYKFEEVASKLGFEFGLSIPDFGIQSLENVPNVATFVQAKAFMDTVFAQSIPVKFSEMKAIIRKEATLWSVEDFVKVSLYINEYASVAKCFRGTTHKREAGLLASQIEGKYLAVYELLSMRD